MLRSILNNKIIKLIALLVLIAVPLIDILLPINFFDKRGFSICLSVILLNKQCWGCGMTKAIHHALHLDFSTAYEYNKLFIIILPLLVYLWFYYVIRIFKHIFMNKVKNIQH